VPHRPDEQIDEAFRRFTAHQSGRRKLVGLWPPRRAEDDVPNWKQLGKILVDVLRAVRMVNTVVLRANAPPSAFTSAIEAAWQ